MIFEAVIKRMIDTTSTSSLRDFFSKGCQVMRLQFEFSHDKNSVILTNEYN